MKESPTLVELSPQEIAELQTLIQRLGPQEYPTVERLLRHAGKDFLFLDGPDCSRVPKEEANLHYERGKVMDAIGKKLERFEWSLGHPPTRSALWSRDERMNMNPSD